MFEGILKWLQRLSVPGAFSKSLDQCKAKQIDHYQSFEVDILVFEKYFLVTSSVKKNHLYG